MTIQQDLIFANTLTGKKIADGFPENKQPLSVPEVADDLR